MNPLQLTVAVLAFLIAPVLGSCSSENGSKGGEHSEKPTTSRGEHDRAGGEHSGERRGEHDRDREGGEGEESGTALALTDRYDSVRNGARLILAYSAVTNSFVGTVENTTSDTLERVRVEVHLSNGKELGPTTPANLAPGEKIDVELNATSQGFDGWTAHPEVGSGEHGHAEEGGEHD